MARLGPGRNDEVLWHPARKGEDVGTEVVTAGAEGADAEGRALIVLIVCSDMAVEDAPENSVERAG